MGGILSGLGAPSNPATYAAAGRGGNAGGGVLNTGRLVVVDSVFSGNSATGGAGGYANSGERGGDGGHGGSAAGGILNLAGGIVVLSGATFEGGTAAGGAWWNVPVAEVSEDARVRAARDAWRRAIDEGKD